MEKVIEKAKKIKCLICDVDGVLTNSMLYIDNLGNELKAFNVQDGLGLKLLLSAEIEVAVITTSRSAIIDHRMNQLGIKHYFKNQVDKRAAYEQLKTKLALLDEEFAYIGDDLPDLPLIQKVGLGVAVANALPLVKQHATWHTVRKGGAGAVRELCDLILETQNKTHSALEHYLQQDYLQQ